ncbi:MAG: HPr family phosphocarrier protein [Gudongella sp.]|nr:HPr family phosphocarrier protein [Gudongella sp.]
MVKKTIKLRNPDGLHARPAALFVKKASGFESELEIKSGDRIVDGKSIIGIMSLGAFHGESITLTAIGPDEEEMINQLSDLIGEGFDNL